LAGAVAARGNVNAASDAATAVHMARAAIESAGMNVRGNAAGLKDKASAERQVQELKELAMRAGALAEQILGDIEKQATFA